MYVFLLGRGLAHTLVYRKPDRRPSPALQPPVQPDELCFTEPDDAKVLRMKELLYTVGRNVLLDMCDDRAVSDTSFPPWTVFQGLVQNDVTSDAVNVAFNPIIMAPPNDFSTVYTVLKRTKEQMNALGQTICPIVFDMGLLSKALEIVWANPREFEGVYPLEGGMHFLMSVFGGIGHLYGDAGLLQLLVESDVFARLTAEHILSGKDYDRALRGLIMVDEVMNRRFFVQFFKWAEANSVAIPPAIFDKIKQLGADVVKRDTDISVLLQDMQTEILPLIESFREEGRTSSPLFRFWDDYLSEVSWPMKLFLAASRHGMWQAQQYAKAKLLPFLFSSNRTVYSRFMPYLVLQHTRLPTELLEQFEEGRFVAKLTEGCFNSVWFDYILEVTENKALKSSGGIIGLTHNDSALTRWFLARPVTAKYAMAYMTHKSSKSLTHHTNTPFHSQAYNTAVQKMLSLFESDTFIDPFSLSFPPSRLVNIASGVEMPSDVETSLLNCHTSGKQSLINFVSERLVPKEGNLPTKEFFDPMPKTKILTTRSIRSKGKPKSGLSPINGEDMYLRLLAINSLKKVPLDRVLSFENAPVPLSLFTDDGSFMSCKKSDFLEKLESLLDSNSYSMTASSPVDCYVYDAMAVVQMIQPQSGVKTTYQMMAASFWKYILAHRQGAKQVHVLFDRYIPDSLKNQTRLVRGETLSSGPVAIQSNMLIGDWKRVMSSTKSKSELTRLYTRFLTENCHELLDDNTVVYVAGGLGAKTLRVTSTYVEYVDSLSSNHEEADTRILLHIAYAGTLDVQQVVVFSPDTDVFVLLVHHFPQLKVGTLYFKTGRKGLHRDMTRYIPVHEVVGSMNRQQKQIMLAVYCITGCDTCSSLHGIGKKKAFQVMSKNADELENLTNLGTEPTISAETKAAAIKLVGLLYGHTNCTSLNALRSVLALRKRPVKPRKMPPTNNSFSLHLLRCIHQLLIWRSALSAMMTSYDPIDFGYSKDLETGIYHPQLMTQAAAPPELLSDLVCTCSDLCADDCVCSHNEQPCTHACRCEGQLKDQVCENLFTMLAHVQTSEFELEDLM